MKELKALAVVVGLTLVMYWGVEPYAHHEMHPPVEAADFKFTDLDDVRQGKVGDALAGKALVVEGFQCQSCHSVTVDGKKLGMSMDLGVMTPDLTSAAYLYDEHYLAAFIADPAKAAKVEHKYEDGAMHPMSKFDLNYDGTFGEDDAQGIADIVAFLKSIAPKEMTDKEAFSDSCLRCHGIKYADMKGGSMAVKTSPASVKAYMGKTPPDLSQYIRSRGHEYLETFINNPQKHLEGTAMPRVGLNEKAQKQVITYMEDIGDSKKSQREELGPKFLIYLVIFAIFGFLWKNAKWREVH